MQRFFASLVEPAQVRAWMTCGVYALVVLAIFIVVGVFMLIANHNARMIERPAIERTK